METGVGSGSCLGSERAEVREEVIGSQYVGRSDDNLPVLERGCDLVRAADFREANAWNEENNNKIILTANNSDAILVY